MVQDFTLFAVLQSGRIAYEAILLAASVARTNPGVGLTFLEPQPGPLWQVDPSAPTHIKDLLKELGATIIPFENKVFGGAYPYGNKIEALLSLPTEKPFLFLDTDTLVLDELATVPFDFSRPTASMKREGTWPKGPDIDRVWKSLYDRFELDFERSLDPSFPKQHWERYLYFNAGFFFGEDPQKFGKTYLEIAESIWNAPSPELKDQKLTPWLDQIALPLTLHKLGGGRDTLPNGLMDGSVTCHYRALSLLYAREGQQVIDFLESISKPNKIKKILKEHEPARKLIYQGVGRDIHSKFDGQAYETEHEIRKALKSANYWYR